MNYNPIKLVAVVTGSLVLASAAPAGEKSPPPGTWERKGLANELVDFGAFAKVAEEAGNHRSSRRITEEQFIAMAGEENTIVVDTRSARRFAMLHVRGAVNLNFSEITTETLTKAIPTKDTRILIYCNNNFDQAPEAFPSKKPSMALNIPTFITLYAYGYKNLYELGPLLDIRKTKIPLEGLLFAKN